MEIILILGSILIVICLIFCGIYIYREDKRVDDGIKKHLEAFKAKNHLEAFEAKKLIFLGNGKAKNEKFIIRRFKWK